MARVSWIFTSKPYYSPEADVNKVLANNPVEFTLLEGQPEFAEYKGNNLDDKVVYRKKYGDPRLVQYHKIQLAYSQMKKAGVDVINTYMRFFGQNIYLKLWQFDARYDSIVSDTNGAVECWPKGDDTYYKYFAPYRNLATDEATNTKVWLNGLALDTGFTIDYEEGSVTFDDERDPEDKVMMNFVWNPKVTILNFDPRPIPGQKFGEQRFTPVVILKEV
ncbi:MAG: hypothetical protein WC479_06935 [Candidatus Izemoplasmatales bacterium]|jgi:hypothetical protein